MTRRRLFRLSPIVAILVSAVPSVAFVVPHAKQHARRAHGPLNDINEWRDLIFDYPGTGDDRRLGTEQGAPPREINILPFPFDQVLLQGETKQLRLYEDRFVKLFEDTLNNHCATVGFGLLADSGIIQKIPICEIEAYNRMDSFGIFVTIRVVGRAELVEFIQQEPYIKAVCIEIADKVPPNLELPNLLAGNIEDSLRRLSQMERRLEEARNQNEVEGEDDEAMQRRINRAKLEDRFYDDEAEEDESELDRAGRYQTAYKIALATDTQGYQLSRSDAANYTPQALTAISWAAFCTDVVPEVSATYRIQALDVDNLFERLKLASHMLTQKEGQVKATLVKAGLEVDKDGDESDS